MTSRRPEFAAARNSPPRRGSIYIIVLFMSMIIAAIGLSSISIARIDLRMTERANTMQMARFLALSGIEHAAHLVEAAQRNEEQGGPPWRLQFTHGHWSLPITLHDGHGTFEWVIEDASGDSDLADDDADPIWITARGTSEYALHKLRITMVPDPMTNPVGLACLEVPLQVGGSPGQSSTGLFFDDHIVDADGLLRCNGDINSNNSIINADVEAAGGVSGWTFEGTVHGNMDPKELPDSDAFNYYLANGTTIPISDLTPGGNSDTWALEWCVLSPYNNPFGAGELNAEGIYIIDCQNHRLEIQNCRIVGTLVLINTKKNHPPIIAGSVHWQPAVPNYPALLVSGDLKLGFERTSLHESGAVNGVRDVNFNPDGPAAPGTPYQGTADIDENDEYPSVIAGLIYVSGESEIVAPATNVDQLIEGVLVVAGQCTFKEPGTLTLRYRNIFLNTPPPGFASSDTLSVDGPVRFVPGSWAQIVD